MTGNTEGLGNFTKTVAQPVPDDDDVEDTSGHKFVSDESVKVPVNH